MKQSMALLVIGLLGACGSMSSAPVADVADVTVCDLARQASKFNGRRVRVTARFRSDGIENTSLTNDECPGVGVAPVLPPARGNDPDITALKDALSVGSPGTLDKDIRATFVGIFRVHRGEIPVRTIDVESITNLRVRPMP